MSFPQFKAGGYFKDAARTTLLFTMEDARGGEPVQLEVLRAQLPEFLNMVLAACASLAEDKLNGTRLQDRLPSESPLLSVRKFHIRSSPPNGPLLLMRLGAVDLSILFEDPAAAAELGHALIAESRRP
ncbi:MAG: hypothetical protein EON54_01410 [Alcaligenaceae bacterium]|nr:MAG: hypothetical protein EON54_01410 [Alcaligenaceae bacterium]